MKPKKKMKLRNGVVHIKQIRPVVAGRKTPASTMPAASCGTTLVMVALKVSTQQARPTRHRASDEASRWFWGSVVAHREADQRHLVLHDDGGLRRAFFPVFLARRWRGDASPPTHTRTPPPPRVTHP